MVQFFSAQDPAAREIINDIEKAEDTPKVLHKTLSDSLKNLTWAKGRVEPRRELAMRLLFCMEKLEEKLHPRQQKDLSLSKSPGTAP